jgi:spore germination protein YaaH
VRAVLGNYGDRISDVSIFGWNVAPDGTLTASFNTANLDFYRAKWPHIRWWACFRNMDHPAGPTYIWESLRADPDARATLASECQRVLSENPWLYGVDIDLEKGGAASNLPGALLVFEAVSNACHEVGKKVSAALPAVTIDGSVGSEDWVDYAQLGQFLDHISIMSYDFAWGGSAPGPISPRWWLEEVYDWASSQVDPAKISMGLPCYGRSWFIHRYPIRTEDQYEYRGSSAYYYTARNLLDGTWITSSDSVNPAGDGDQPHVGWLAYRDADSGCPMAYPHVYDWTEPDGFSSQSGMKFFEWNGHKYAVRYSLPSGDPLYSVADNTVTDGHVDYVFAPRAVRDVNGAWAGPQDGYTLTVELLKRNPDSATIIDDNLATPGQFSTMYEVVSGAFIRWPEDDGYTRPDVAQVRGHGVLDWQHSFPGQALHVLARFQHPGAGCAGGVHIGQASATVSDEGRVSLMVGGAEVGVAWIAAPGVNAVPGSEPRTVCALRVREKPGGGWHIRCYASNTEENVPCLLQADMPESGHDGTVGIVTDGEDLWFDHLRLGDGWLYQPREAVEVRLGEWSWLVGRIPRTGIVWDSANRFRPVNDVDEWETRSGNPDREQDSMSQDWVFDHLVDFPIATGQTKTVSVIPVDVDCWLGRIFLGDRNGFQIVWFSDVAYLAGWIDEGHRRWGLQGAALWTIGQEDVRLWERLRGGATPAVKF